MKAVILAAGKGKRMGSISNEIPKPLLLYKGKNLIQHKLEQLPDDITEIIIVVGHLGAEIIATIGRVHNERLVKYVWQKDLLGTAHSLWIASNLLDTPFLVLMGDDLYTKKDLQEMIRLHKKNSSEWIALVQKTEGNMSIGKCVIDENGKLQDFVDDPENILPENILYTGACLLTPDIFEHRMIKPEGKEEYGLPHTFIQAKKSKNIHALHAAYWKRITTPEDLI